MMRNEYIRQKVGVAEIMATLAEEAIELAKAALKYRRTLISGNPTNITQAQALEELREEIADVDLCLVIAGEDICEETDEELLRMEAKRNRWIMRLSSEGKE